MKAVITAAFYIMQKFATFKTEYARIHPLKWYGFMYLDGGFATVVASAVSILLAPHYHMA